MSNASIPWEDYRVRPVRREDVDGLFALLQKSRDQLTTLPKTREGVERCIRKSIHSFHPDVVEPGDEIYFLVLEHLPTGALLGLGAVHARIGGFSPFYTFQLEKEAAAYPPLQIERTATVLTLSKRHSGPSELGSLYLDPTLRGGGLGRFLSLARLMLVLTLPHRFQDEVMAEIRGWHDAAGRSPFWERVARLFYGGDFRELDTLSGMGEKQFIEALLPRHPIYLDLLPEEARKVVGQPNDAALPALRILEREGFQRVDEVDIFDAGPTIRARVDDLRLKQELSNRVTVQETASSIVSNTPMLVAATDPEFTCSVRPGTRNSGTCVLAGPLPNNQPPETLAAAPLFSP